MGPFPRACQPAPALHRGHSWQRKYESYPRQESGPILITVPTKAAAAATTTTTATAHATPLHQYGFLFRIYQWAFVSLPPAHIGLRH